MDAATPAPKRDPIRDLRQLIDRIESNPQSAAQVDLDPWERWLLRHGAAAIVGADLDEWAVACLRCIVRHSGVEERVPQKWLFEGGPDNDPALRQFRDLSDEARKKRLSRLVTQLAKLRQHLGLDWKLERAVDCSKTVYTAHTNIYTFTLPAAAKR